MHVIEARERFPLAKPRFGRARGAVRVAGALVVDHPLIRQAIVVPYEQIAGYAAGDDLDVVDPHLVLERDLRVLSIKGRPDAPTSAIVILRTPVDVGPFKLGADRAFAISGRERRAGIAVSVLDLGVEGGDDLVAALRAAGVRAAPLPQLLREVGGEAFGPAREARVQASLAAHRRVVRTLTASAVLTTVVLALRVLELVSDDIDWDLGFVVQLGVASLLCMLLSSVWLLRPGRPAPVGSPEPPPVRSPVRTPSVVVLAIAALTAVAVGGADLPRPAVIGLGAVFAGGLGGLVLIQVPRLGGPPLPGIVTTAPSPRDRRWRGPVALLVVIAAVIAAVALLGPSETDHVAERATIAAEELPGRWSERYSGPFDGDLDEHICGGDDDALPAHTGGYARGFARDQDPQGIGPIWVDLTVLLAPDEAAAAAEFAAVDAPGYESCLLERVEQMTEDHVADDAGPARSHLLARSVPDVGSPIVVDRTVSEYLSEDGSMHHQHIVFVRMQVDRAIVRMPISSFRGPISDPEVEALARLVHERVDEALSAAG